MHHFSANNKTRPGPVIRHNYLGRQREREKNSLTFCLVSTRLGSNSPCRWEKENARRSTLMRLINRSHITLLTTSCHLTCSSYLISHCWLMIKLGLSVICNNRRVRATQPNRRDWAKKRKKEKKTTLDFAVFSSTSGGRQQKSWENRS